MQNTVSTNTDINFQGAGTFHASRSHIKYLFMQCISLYEGGKEMAKQKEYAKFPLCHTEQKPDAYVTVERTANTNGPDIIYPWNDEWAIFLGYKSDHLMWLVQGRFIEVEIKEQKEAK